MRVTSVSKWSLHSLFGFKPDKLLGTGPGRELVDEPVFWPEISTYLKVINFFLSFVEKEIQENGTNTCQVLFKYRR